MYEMLYGSMIVDTSYRSHLGSVDLVTSDKKRDTKAELWPRE
jgi:hypothetical protein